MSGKRDYYYSEQSSSSSSSSTTLTRPVRRHLVNVYLTLAAMCAIATIGSQVGDYFGPSSSTLGSLGAVGSVTMFRYTSMNSRRRWGLLAVKSRLIYTFICTDRLTHRQFIKHVGLFYL